MLKPNEKLVISNNDMAVPGQKGNQPKLADNKVNGTEKPIITLSHLTFLPADSTVIETAWVQNRLLFSSETFEDVALKMERWYNVKIDFADDNLKDSKLTGNFEKETVGEAFNALQLTTKFLYAIKSDRITVYSNRSTIVKK